MTRGPRRARETLRSEARGHKSEHREERTARAVRMAVRAGPRCVTVPYARRTGEPATGPPRELQGPRIA